VPLGIEAVLVVSQRQEATFQADGRRDRLWVGQWETAFSTAAMPEFTCVPATR